MTEYLSVTEPQGEEENPSGTHDQKVNRQRVNHREACVCVSCVSQQFNSSESIKEWTVIKKQWIIYIRMESCGFMSYKRSEYHFAFR